MTKLSGAAAQIRIAMQAPRGVYAAIAAVARTRFASEADIRFTFRDIPLKKGGTSRNPAIVVRLEGDGVDV